MTYAEALTVAEQMGFTKTKSWKTGSRSGYPGYAVTDMKVGSRLFELLQPFRATPMRWRGAAYDENAS